MRTNSCTAFWAALLSSTVWAASANPYSTAMAMVWGALAVLLLAVDTAAAWEEKKRSNVESSGDAPLHGAASAGTQGSVSQR